MDLLKKRNQSIDLVKIFAMFGVMALHSTINDTNTVAGFVLSRIFGISVPLFFMVSGYLLSQREISWEYSLYKIKGILRFCFTMCFFYWLFRGIVKGSWPTMIIWDFLGCFFQKGHMWMFWYFGAMIFIYLILPKSKKIIIKPSVVLVLFFIVSIVFYLNVSIGFEEQFINQTLRIWNWLFYFSLGAFLRDKIGNFSLSPFIMFILLLLFSIIFCGFTFVLYNKIPGIEYYFGSVCCVIYAIAMFVFLAGRHIENNRVISSLSSLFLPVYALHWEVKMLLSTIDTSSLGPYSALVQFILLSMVTISFSWLVMRISFLSKYFKI